MSREGTGTILVVVVIMGILTTGAFLTPRILLTVLSITSILATVLTVYFFRDPERTISDETSAILSPADGKVVEIKDEFEGNYLKAETTRVSIFLSVFDVHVNRIPISGTVGYFQYQRGDFLKAYKSEASEVNEQTIIGIENNEKKILFKQIAGLLARRIVCYVRQGHRVKLGERFGIIKFGSRVDIFLPQDVEIKVKLRQRVKGGESIIGVFSHDKED